MVTIPEPDAALSYPGATPLKPALDAPQGLLAGLSTSHPIPLLQASLASDGLRGLCLPQLCSSHQALVLERGLAKLCPTGAPIRSSWGLGGIAIKRDLFRETPVYPADPARVASHWQSPESHWAQWRGGGTLPLLPPASPLSEDHIKMSLLCKAEGMPLRAGYHGNHKCQVPCGE